uniref:RxLR effector candidate protein n=1 Tax=Hyaloperonospora arabidopsidis (strain Emoy2) TaxID=559515 RepID=M4BCS4_HYAAE
MQLNRVFLIVTLLQSLTASDFASAAKDHVDHTSGTATNVKNPSVVAPERSFNFRDSITSTANTASQEERRVSVAGRSQAVITDGGSPQQQPEMVTNSTYENNGLLQRFQRWVDGVVRGQTKSRRLRFRQR